jgi:hypothetical protein
MSAPAGATRSSPGGSGEARIRWAVAIVASLVVTILVTTPVWPGFMSHDSLLVYRESMFGVRIAQQPPIHAYLFYVFRVLGLGTGGLFFVQTFVLFTGSALIMRRFIRPLPLFVAAFAFFVASFYYFPTMIGALIVQWKDVLAASFFIFGFALWLETNERRSYALLAAAVFCMFVSAAARFNAIALSIVPLILMVVRPFGQRRPPPRVRTAAAAIVACGLFAVFAEATWRLPDFQRLPSENGQRITMSWDLLAVSACEGVDLLPPEFGRTLSRDELRALYDYRLFDVAYMKRPGYAQLPESAFRRPGDTAVQRAWARVIPTHLGCYAAHRTSVLTGLLGLVNEPVIEPTAGGIDPNPFGLHLEHDAAAAELRRFIIAGDGTLWRRVFILFALAPVLVFAIVRLLGREFAALRVLLLSAYLYFASLVLAAPATAGRYPFASSVACLLITVIAASLLAMRYVKVPGARATPLPQPSPKATFRRRAGGVRARSRYTGIRRR